MHYSGDEPFERSKEQIQESLREQRIVEMVRAFMERSQAYREPFLELARKSREMYETWQSPSTSQIQRANLKLPFGFTVIETQLPQIMDIFFQSGSSPVRFIGRGPDDAKWENLLTDFHQYQLEEMSFETKTAAFIKSLLLDGTAICKVPYRFKELEVIRRLSIINPQSGEVETRKFPVVEEIFDQPDLEPVAIYDFFPDWSVKIPGDITSMRGCVHRSYRTLASLRSDRKYKNLDKLEQSLTIKGTSAWAPPYYDNDGFKRDFERLQDQAETGIKDGRIEIWEYWGLYDPQQNGNFKEYLIVIANGDVVIRAEENFYDYKFKPFVASVNYIRENEFYGIPELLAIRPLIKEANTLRNARLDVVNLSVNPMMLVDRAGGIVAKSLFSRPGGVVWTNDMNAVKPLEVRDPSAGSLNEFSLIQQDIQNATALVNAAPTVSQLGKQFGRSATGVNFIQGLSSSRVGLKARLLADLYFKRVAWIMLMTNRQFVTDEKWVRVSDPNAPNPFQVLPPDAFFQKFDFAVSTNLDSGGVEGQFQKMQSVSQILQAAEQSQPGTAKMDVLLEALLRPILGRQTKRFVRSDEERQQMQQQQLAATQMLNAQIGKAAPQPNAGAVASVSPTEQVLSNLGLRT